MNRFYDHKYIPYTVPAALTAYDLPDLAVSLAPARLVITGMKDGNGERGDTESIRIAEETIKKGYLLKGATEMLEITDELKYENLFQEKDSKR